MVPASDPFCDFLSLTFPLAGDGAPHIVGTVILFLSELGCVLESEGVYKIGAYEGTIMSKRRGQIWILSFTGAAMRSIREGGLLRDLAMLLSEVPHRVTRLDASCDYATDAPPFLERLYRRVRKSSLVLGRKVIRVSDCEVHFHTRDDGRRSGGIYLGGRYAEVRALVYDKQSERIKKGYPDPGEMLRIEIRLRSQVGCSVFDAVEPARLYYHYAAPDLVSLPESVRPWKANGQGFELQQQPAHSTPYQRLKWLIGESAVIELMLRLCQQEGAGGLRSVYTLLDRRVEAMAKKKAAKLSLVP